MITSNVKVRKKIQLFLKLFVAVLCAWNKNEIKNRNPNKYKRNKTNILRSLIVVVLLN
jgi:hypothetical protein